MATFSDHHEQLRDLAEKNTQRVKRLFTELGDTADIGFFQEVASTYPTWYYSVIAHHVIAALTVETSSVSTQEYVVENKNISRFDRMALMDWLISPEFARSKTEGIEFKRVSLKEGLALAGKYEATSINNFNKVQRSFLQYLYESEHDVTDFYWMKHPHWSEVLFAIKRHD